MSTTRARPALRAPPRGLPRPRRPQGDQLRALLGVIASRSGAARGATSTASTTTGSSRPATSGSSRTSATCSASAGCSRSRTRSFSQRGLVANTIAYRRAKGTAAVLEQLARDVTGWPAKAVEFFELLATHARDEPPSAARDVALVEVRDADAAELAGGAVRARGAPRRRPPRRQRARGSHNIPNVGLHLWRLQPYALERVTPRRSPRPDPDARAAATRSSPLGRDIRLFNVPRAEHELDQLAGEANVPGPLRRRPLHDELERTAPGDRATTPTSSSSTSTTASPSSRSSSATRASPVTRRRRSSPRRSSSAT